MDWSNFRHHGNSPDRAFEAYCCLLFEKYCRKEYENDFQQIYFINGAGGDGGVEAYVLLKDRSLIGLQAKWFREPLKSKQIDQIRDSLEKAIEVRDGLIKYIVCIPRDLSDGKRKQERLTERDRWNNFITECENNHLNVDLLLWEETKLQQIMGELCSNGFERYWFDKKAIDLGYLKTKFDAACNSWLYTRYGYAPDYHIVGEIEKDLQIRLNGFNEVASLLKDVEKVINCLEYIYGYIARLPFHNNTDSISHLIQPAEEWIKRAIRDQKKVLTFLNSRISFPIDNINEYLQVDRIDDSIIEILNSLRTLKSDSEYINQFEEIVKKLEKAIEIWYSRKVTFNFLNQYNLPVAYIGERGSGKTHAVANMVKIHLANNKPAIIIRAKDYNPSSSWADIFRNEFDEPTWSLKDIFNALESIKFNSDVEECFSGNKNNKYNLSRSLIVIDGLDESSDAIRWQEKVAELNSILNNYPGILCIYTLRTSLSKKITIRNSSKKKIYESDVPLDFLFFTYCKRKKISCSPLLRWALRTPLSIRLFSELYENKTIVSLSEMNNLSLNQLVQHKFNSVEKEILESEKGEWGLSVKPVFNFLNEIVKSMLNNKLRLTTTEVINLCHNSLDGIIAKETILKILNKCCDSGLLSNYWPSSEDIFENQECYWEPAYEVLTDYFIAYNMSLKILEKSDLGDIPESLRSRDNAIFLSIILASQKGFKFFNSNIWSKGVWGLEKEVSQLIIISHLTHKEAIKYQNWVKDYFVSSMPASRNVIKYLIISNLRNPDFYYSAEYIHSILFPMTIIERDLFWSGPDYLPYNSGGKWEGNGERIFDNFEVANDDPWNTSSLLLTWSFSSVNNVMRRKNRKKLSLWASSNPEGFLCLLNFFSKVNDQQIIEDLFIVIYGAINLILLNEKWIPIWNWMVDYYCEYSKNIYSYSIIIQKVILSSYERFQAHKIKIDNFPAIIRESSKLMPIDCPLFEKKDSSPFFWDLHKYSIEKNIKLFFPHDYNWGENEKKESVFSFEQIPENVLVKYLSGKIRSSIPQSSIIVDQIMKMLKQKKIEDEEQEKEREKLSKLVDEILSGRKKRKVADEDEEIIIPLSLNLKNKEKRYSLEANKLLHEYGIDFSEVIPIEFAKNIIATYIYRIGWTEEIFYGKPNGEKSGEIIAPDIAIFRKHYSGSRGERSSVSTFAEKYAFLGIHEMVGHLSDKIPVVEYNKIIQPPGSKFFLADFHNPASDIDSFKKVKTDDNIFDFSIFTPSINLKEKTQLDRANEWVLNSPFPNIKLLFHPEKYNNPIWAHEHDWVILKGFCIAKDEESQAESAIWISSAVFPSQYQELIMEDLENDIFDIRLEESSTYIDSLHFYIDPKEAMWASWLKEDNYSIDHDTLDMEGCPLNIEFFLNVCKQHTETEEGEYEYCFPAKWIRKELNIVDIVENKFINEKGEVVAFYHEKAESLSSVKISEALLIRKDKMDTLIQKKDYSLCWGIRNYREPDVALLDGTENRFHADWYAFSLLMEKEIETYVLSEKRERW